jgi:hypothetical protein
MATLNRVRVAWTGLTGLPGVSTFYFGSSTTDMTGLKAFFTSMVAYVPSGITWTIPSLGDSINDTDGKINGSWIGTNGGQVLAGASNSNWSGVSGLAIGWQSGLIVNGRRVQGRTFFVPTGNIVYQSDGTIVDATRTTIIGNANALIAAYAGEMKVFSRPFPGRAADPGPPIKPAIPARVGVGAQVIAAKVPDKAVVLRSRRD